MDNNALPDDVWAAARLIWENTVKITDSELIEQLTVSFGDAAPKSTGTISKRRSKHKWKKNTLAEATKRQSKQGESGNKSRNNGNNKARNNSTIPSKTNKAQNRNNPTALEVKSGIIDDLMDSVIIDAKGRAAIIKTFRRRYGKLGDLFDQALDVTLSIPELVEAANQAEADAMSDVSNANYGANFEIGENSGPVPSSDVDGVSVVEMANQKVKQAMVLSKSLTDTTTSLAVALKMISEVAMPMMGITVDDFKQSEQDRRLGALASLGDIDDKEREARARLVPELHARLLELEQFEASPDFGAEYKDDRSDDEIDEVDYTSVDD